MGGSIRRCTAHKQFRLKVRQRRPKSLEKAVAFASEVEAMEQTEYCKHTRAVHVNNPPEVLTVNNDETNQILKRSHYILLSKISQVLKELNACNMESQVSGYFM